MYFSGHLVKLRFRSLVINLLQPAADKKIVGLKNDLHSKKSVFINFQESLFKFLYELFYFIYQGCISKYCRGFYNQESSGFSILKCSQNALVF